jgi:hypothetical protein
MREKENERNKKSDEVLSKKRARKEAAQARYNVAFGKHVAAGQLLTSDLKVLIAKFARRVDSPLRTRVAELRDQWRRRSYRLEEFCNIATLNALIPTTSTATSTVNACTTSSTYGTGFESETDAVEGLFAMRNESAPSEFLAI